MKCITNSTEVMRLHNKDSIEDLLDRNINTLTHVNDGAKIFNYKEDVEKAAQ